MCWVMKPHQFRHLANGFANIQNAGHWAKLMLKAGIENGTYFSHRFKK